MNLTCHTSCKEALINNEPAISHHGLCPNSPIRDRLSTLRYCDLCETTHRPGTCKSMTLKKYNEAGEYESVKDSGERREFSTGSVRDVRKGKGRFDLIPPCSLRRLAKHYENGAHKYGDRNWEKGQPLSSYVDSMLRHGQDYLSGDRSEDHLAAIAWNAFAIMFTEELIRLEKLPSEFNDMPTTLEEREACE